jgi:hypothetical protein
MNGMHDIREDFVFY